MKEKIIEYKQKYYEITYEEIAKKFNIPEKILNISSVPLETNVTIMVETKKIKI